MQIASLALCKHKVLKELITMSRNLLQCKLLTIICDRTYINWLLILFVFQSEEKVKVSVAKPVELEFTLDDRLREAVKSATLQFEKMVGATNFLLFLLLSVLLFIRC